MVAKSATGHKIGINRRPFDVSLDQRVPHSDLGEQVNAGGDTSEDNATDEDE